jgi:hypothetical protein
VPIGDPDALAHAIDQALTNPKPANLRDLAQAYRIDAAVDAHIMALADAVQVQKRTDTPV